MNIIINPGAGPVQGGDYEQAYINIKQLIKDCELDMKIISSRHIPDDGRYLFVLRDPLGNDYEVDMPGLPLEQVRFMSLEGQNIFEFPRLYVDGSSWVWEIVANSIFTKESLQKIAQEKIEEAKYEIEKLKEQLQQIGEKDE